MEAASVNLVFSVLRPEVFERFRTFKFVSSSNPRELQRESLRFPQKDRANATSDLCVNETRLFGGVNQRDQNATSAFLKTPTQQL